jgi:hypothetical protein
MDRCKISKRAVAREWLVFLALLPLGWAVCFYLEYYPRARLLAYYGYNLRQTYDDFWNDHFGLTKWHTLSLWLLPYLAVTLIRSVWWAIKTLTAKAN